MNKYFRLPSTFSTFLTISSGKTVPPFRPSSVRQRQQKHIFDTLTQHNNSSFIHRSMSMSFSLKKATLMEDSNKQHLNIKNKIWQQ